MKLPAGESAEVVPDRRSATSMRRESSLRPLQARARARWQATLDVLDQPVDHVVREHVLRRLDPAPLPSKPEDGLRVITLNIAHGRKRVPHQTLVPRDRVRRNLTDVGALIAGLESDIVALQEADGPSPWSGNFDHVAIVAARAQLGEHYRGDHNPFSLGGRSLASGTALLARWPLGDPRSVRFQSSWRCTKGFVLATVALPAWRDQEVDVVSVHLDPLVPQKRRGQVADMVGVLRGRGRPLVVLGDLNCCWRREPATMDLLSNALGLRSFAPDRLQPTYPAYRPRRRFDWILISESLRFVGHRRLPAKLSDHLGVMADLRLR